jgi:hypothetical protein
MLLQGHLVDEEAAIEGAVIDQPIIRASEFGRNWHRAMRSLANSGRAINEEVANELHLVEPSSRAELLYLEELMNEYRSEALAHYMGMFKSKAQARTRTKRTPAMHQMLKHWRRPEWMKGTSTTGVRPPAPTNPTRQWSSRGPNPVVERQRVAQQLGLDPTEENLQRLGSVTSPNNFAHPEVWQSFFANYAGPQTSAWGLRRQPGVRIDERALRTMLRFRAMFATRRVTDGVEDTAGLRVRIIGYTILATPGRYQALLQQGNMTVANVYGQDRRDLAEPDINDLNVARIMADNGVTPVEADDAWWFASQWLEDTLVNPQTHGSVRDLLLHSIESTRSTAPPVGGGLPDSIPVIWDTTLLRWRPDPTVIATGNANLQIHVVQNGAVVPTLTSTGNAASETTTTTTTMPGDATMLPPDVTPPVTEDTTMSSSEALHPSGSSSSSAAPGADSSMDHS